MRLLKTISILAAILSMVAFGCSNKNTEVDYNPNVLSSKDYIFSEDVFMEVFNTYFKSINNSEVLAGENGWIDHATVDYSSVDNTMLFNYGEVNRGCPDGKFRRGHYEAVFNGPVNEEGTEATISFHDFYVNDDKVTGNVTSRFLGNEPGSWLYSYIVSGGLIEKYDTIDTVRIRYSCDFEMSWDEGSETPDDPVDDILSITGISGGVSAENVEFSASVAVPLMNHIDCFYLASGIHEITVPSAPVSTGTIDYIIEDDCGRMVNFYFDENRFFDQLYP